MQTHGCLIRMENEIIIKETLRAILERKNIVKHFPV